MADNTEIKLDPGNAQVAKLFDGADYVLSYAAIGDVERSPVLNRYALNRQYVDDLINVILSGFQGQCALVIAVRPLPASAHGSHSSFGQGDDLLLSMDEQVIQRGQAKLRSVRQGDEYG